MSKAKKLIKKQFLKIQNVKNKLNRCSKINQIKYVLLQIALKYKIPMLRLIASQKCHTYSKTNKLEDLHTIQKILEIVSVKKYIQRKNLTIKLMKITWMVNASNMEIIILNFFVMKNFKMKKNINKLQNMYIAIIIAKKKFIL